MYLKKGTVSRNQLIKKLDFLLRWKVPAAKSLWLLKPYILYWERDQNNAGPSSITPVAMFNQLGIENPIPYFSRNALSVTKEHRQKAKKVTQPTRKHWLRK